MIANNKEELEEAFKNRASEIVITDPDFFKKVIQTSKFTSHIRIPKTEDGFIPNRCGIAIETTILLGLAILCVTAITIVALVKGYNVDMEYDNKEQKFKTKYNKKSNKD